MEYYVYELQYPNGTPFYVGKGKGKRAYSHLTLNGYVGNKLKREVISSIRDNNEEPVVKIIVSELSESDAYKLENTIISFYGKSKYGGILTNINGGTKDYINKYKKVATKEQNELIFTRQKYGRFSTEYTKMFYGEDSRQYKVRTIPVIERPLSGSEVIYHKSIMDAVGGVERMSKRIKKIYKCCMGDMYNTLNSTWEFNEEDR